MGTSFINIGINGIFFYILGGASEPSEGFMDDSNIYFF